MKDKEYLETVADRRTLSVNAVAYEYLKVIQQLLERQIGFKPSMSQVIVYLASKVDTYKLMEEV
jgi:uncharacterized protein YaeQ